MTSDNKESSLFREEAIDTQKSSYLGSVIFTPDITSRYFLIFSICSFISVLLFITIADYTRKERVTGVLIPDSGLVHVYSPQPGIIQNINTTEGSQVKKGDSLIVVSNEQNSSMLGETHAEIILKLNNRRSDVISTISQLKKLEVLESENLKKQIKAFRNEHKQISKEVEFKNKSIALLNESYQRYLKLKQTGVISINDLHKHKIIINDHRLDLQTIKREQATINRKSLILKSKLEELPITTSAKIFDKKQQLNIIEQELASIEAQRESIITAPLSGTVTTQLANMADRINTSSPILSISPDGSKLQAHLFCTSKSIGFLKNKQSVLLRYQAYPYQKFGSYKGNILTFSRSTMNVREMSSYTLSKLNRDNNDEPVYRIIVELEKQQIDAYGKQIQLHAGMKLEADILIESRKLYEWILDPLYTLTG